MTDASEQGHDGRVLRDKKVLWHPFADMAAWEREDPPVIASGEGSWLVDDRGRRILDGTASLWVNLLGHRHPALDRALASQLESIAHSTFLGATHEPAILLAERLVALAPPGLDRVFYSDNGSTAVEIALKLAYLLTRNRRLHEGAAVPSAFFSLDRSYHGDTLGAVGAGGIERFHRLFGPLVRPSISAPAPDCTRCPAGLTPAICHLECADLAVRILEDHRREIAAVILEPLLQAAGGFIVWPQGFLGRLARACRILSIPLILDEVATGFGRTGTLFACEQEGVIPDFLVLGKGLTGGYLPLAATLVTEEVYRSVRADPGAFYHGHSYTANPLGCRVALATLDALEEEELLPAIPDKRRGVLHLWQRRLSIPAVSNLRSLGLVMAFDLVDSRGRPQDDPRITSLIRDRAFAAGLLVRPLGATFYLIPPLSVSLDEILQMAEILADTVVRASEEGIFSRNP